MRTNLPVTQREHDFPPGATLMSTTDLQSNITYANDAFVTVSGYGREELEGQPHNLVRHPDMPPEAFADMWATLRGGEPWTAIVKNRRKNGDHYWVRANAMPLVRQGRPVGYLSVRTKPGSDEVAAAQALHARFRDGKAGGLRFNKGLVSHAGLMRWRSWGQAMPVRWRLRLTTLATTAAVIALAAAQDLPARGLLELGAGTAACLAAATWWLQRQITTPLERMREAALRVASGDAQSTPHLDRVDEIGMTMRAIGQVGLTFRWIIDDVASQVHIAGTATAEIAQGTSDLSARTEQAAASVQETAASMEQMTSTVQNNAASAREASQLSDSASDIATRGGVAVSHVVDTMNDITDSSRRISDIIGVIDSIAFQTNILALNAAVEAARAGEQGRGFAVVAGEVQSLARRSADAAKEIKTLITDSVERVEAGCRQVGDAGRTMEDIVAQVGRVSTVIGAINTATIEQTSGIAQVAQAIAHIDQVTQQNAALVEQSSAASESLRQQMARLAAAVDVFRQGAAPGAAGPAPAGQPSALEAGRVAA
jgi:aerotaxis receptor